ncbi:triacylglycerol lipase [Paenibacillus sp. UNC496MF]|uniref:lipase family protein n=1 Tax=Paenibacillus sp. UNC496MF TaxID=1502753 RepID=UPI0008ED45E3|nr:lipase family protein [Paenibacillus sp. UNC496MF]SFJ51550.1 triacylglycerol lipase [Paenibacillus sp. UNC496MF]
MSNGSSADLRTAIFLAAICGQTYVQYDNGGLFLMPDTYRLIGPIGASSYAGKEELFGFVLESDRGVIVAFRGTISPTDWITDMIAQQVAFKPAGKGCLAHRGFNDVYMSARDALFRLLSDTTPGKPVFVTGHSLGGALGTLAALDIALNRKPANLVVYTFGSPRVGDPAFARSYNAAVPVSFRIENEFDVVPHLPPLVYTSPKTDKTYYYMHVKEDVKRSFRNGSVGGNHVIGSYFADLAKDAPGFAAAICSGPPGWCPSN